MAPPPVVESFMSRGGAAPADARPTIPQPPTPLPIIFDPIRILDLSVPIWVECGLGPAGQRIVVFLVSVVASRAGGECDAEADVSERKARSGG